MTVTIEDRARLAQSLRDMPTDCLVWVLRSVKTYRAREGLRSLLDEFGLSSWAIEMLRISLDEGDRGADPAEVFRVVYEATVARVEQAPEDAIPLSQRLRRMRRMPTLGEPTNEALAAPPVLNQIKEPWL